MDRLVVRIQKLVQGGDGFVLAPDGRAMFVSGSLPGELVSCRVIQEKKSFLRAKLVEVLEPSPDRVVPACPYYHVCGGCNLMHLASASQARAKQDIVLENLRRIGGLSLDNDCLDFDESGENATGHPDLGYRSRVRFHVDVLSGKAGFLGAGTRSLVDIPHCPILVPALGELLGSRRDELIHSAKKVGGHSRPLRGAVNSKRFSATPTEYVEVSAIAGDTDISFDSHTVDVSVAGKTFQVDSQVFFQSNRFVLPDLISYVLQQVVGKRVMDLYAGVGTFSAFLEQAGKDVVAVERDPRCLELARRNVAHTQFFTGAVEQWGQRRTMSVDTVVVDPPRVGLDTSVPDMIASWHPQRVIYVSCDSVTLARDLQRFLQAGYSPVKVKVFDFYPQTFHQESVLVLDSLDRK